MTYTTLSKEVNFYKLAQEVITSEYSVLCDLQKELNNFYKLRNKIQIPWPDSIDFRHHKLKLLWTIMPQEGVLSGKARLSPCEMSAIINFDGTIAWYFTVQNSTVEICTVYAMNTKAVEERITDLFSVYYHYNKQLEGDNNGSN